MEYEGGHHEAYHYYLDFLVMFDFIKFYFLKSSYYDHICIGHDHIGIEEPGASGGPHVEGTVEEIHEKDSFKAKDIVIFLASWRPLDVGWCSYHFFSIIIKYVKLNNCV